MACAIRDVPAILASLVNQELSYVLLTSRSRIMWKCAVCDGVWKESVVKRAKYSACPECERSSKRSAKVSGGNVLECEICCLPVRSVVTCPGCAWKCCKKCTEIYVLSGKEECMKCHHAFSLPFLHSIYGSKWMSGKFNRHRVDVWVEKETARLPECMHLVNDYKRTLELDREIKALRGKLVKCENTYGGYFMDEDLVKYRERAFVYSHQIGVAEQELNALHERVYGKSNPKVTTFIQGCPVDGCKGLVSDDYVCILCGERVCRNCMEPVHSGRCSDECVASVREIKCSTKPCPKCAIPVYKVDGCDQMWCVECKTAFGWTSGKIDEGTIHNPHYFQWLRTQTKGDIPRDAGRCDRVTHDMLLDRLDMDGEYWEITAGRIFGTLDIITPDPKESLEQGTKIARMKYLAGLYSESKWRRKVSELYTRYEMDVIRKELDDGLSLVLTERIEAMYKELVERGRGEAIRIAAKYKDEFERIRLEFIDHTIKAYAHMPRAIFWVYKEDWEWGVHV